MTGFINVFKTEGASSTSVVNRIKRLSRTPCGHMGTLDPLACGVLPVGVGNATRLFNYFLGKTKTYEARFRFGVTTDTLDREGELIGQGMVPSKEEIESVLGCFTGEIDQIPPKFSAKNVNGRRGYELARAGEDFVLPPKRVRIEKVELTGQTSPDEYSFRIVCGGGTYIRSLARDIAEKCGTIGYMSYLCRTQSGIFTADRAVKIEELTEENLSAFLIPTESVLPFPVLKCVNPRLFNGLACKTDEENGQYKIYRNGIFYGIAEVNDGLAKITTKLC